MKTQESTQAPRQHVIIMSGIVIALVFNLSYISYDLLSKRPSTGIDRQVAQNLETIVTGRPTNQLTNHLESEVHDQRFDEDGNWRKSNWQLKRLQCTKPVLYNKPVDAFCLVLNSFRFINTSMYIFKNQTYKRQFIINTTILAQTNNWERNCQQAHTQALEAAFRVPGVNYALILEDDALVSDEVSEQEFKDTLNCAIENKINFVSLIHNNKTQYWYGTVAYLISRIFYFDVMRCACFGTNSPLPIDMCFLNNFYLMVTNKNLVKHPEPGKYTTRHSFDLTGKKEADLTRFKTTEFDDCLLDLNQVR